MNVSYQGKTWHKLYVVKFLSLDSMTDDQLKTIFHRGHVVWTSRTSWAAYPRLEPKSNFDSFEVAENLYNINAMERWISTMETSTIAAKNVVALVLQKWLGAGFVLGQRCSWDKTSKVWQWDQWGCVQIGDLYRKWETSEYAKLCIPKLRPRTDNNERRNSDKNK